MYLCVRLLAAMALKSEHSAIYKKHGNGCTQKLTEDGVRIDRGSLI